MEILFRFIEKQYAAIIEGSIYRIIDNTFNNTPAEYIYVINFAILLISGFFLIFIFYSFGKKAIKFIGNYIVHRKKHAQYKIEFPGAFAWGNSILRAPLVAIGTDILSFAKLSPKDKTLRYVKSASVLIPTVWSILGMILFVVTTRRDFQEIDLYIAALPIILVGLTVYILDISIINSQGGHKAKLIRSLLAITTGYIFSSAPLNYYFKSDIDSFMKQNDSQLTIVENNFNEKITTIQNSEWKKDLTKLRSTQNTQLLEMGKERMGLGVSKLKNSISFPTMNIYYNQIKSELDKTQDMISKIEKNHNAEQNELDELLRNKNDSIEKIRADNNFNHIKRHNALWSYAFSSVGTALYFLAFMALFWTIDSLSVLCSFINESEYENYCSKNNTSNKNVFDNDKYKEEFKPKIKEISPNDVG
jgi:Domain of unknown function (DUF4407)